MDILPVRAVLCLVAVLLGPFATIGTALGAERPPNVLLILADDLGYSDLGCYGGEIRTPNLDRLASAGLRFTQFYNTARCWPSRAAILTGYYAQQVGRDAIPGVGGGAQGRRPPWAPLLPQLLEPLGYRSYHSGKWHVDGMPVENGFAHSYLLQDQDRYFSPRVHFEDDQKLPPVEPDSGYYATVAIADHAIKCLREHAREHADKAFFHYLAFTCPHFPLHALEEDIARYRGRFSEGWDVLRSQRLARMRQMGIVDCELSARTPGVPAWGSVAGPQKDAWQIRMAVHAAMVDRMDREIGRVLDQLRSMRAMQNTLILFMSDNGASAEKILRGDGHDPAAAAGSWRSYLCLEPAWANLANAPLRRSKIFVHEGGISTPLIVHWPQRIIPGGSLRHTPAHLIDLVPTILELAGGAKPRTWKGTQIPPAPGRSLVGAFAGDSTIERDYLWWFHSGNRALRVGDWKIVSEGDGPWELYDLSTDRCESKNLIAEQPQRAAELERVWNDRLAEFRLLASE